MILLCLVTAVGVATAALPNLPDCVPAQVAPFDQTNPINLFGVNHEIGIKATPKRVGNLRQLGPLPTGHFATGHIKNNDIWPMIVTPYQSLLTDHGAVHDAYTMDRWSDPERTDLMEQQSPWEAGKPWNKLNNLGSNMRQMTSGPDGNPKSAFTGKSGVQVSIEGAGEPELQSFGELYANFLYKSSYGGSMEIPVVRGSAFMTHILKAANPVVKPFCLSSINGNSVKFDCPLEPSAGDGGGGHLEGECHGSTLTITLHNSKAIRDITKIQWAAETKSDWGRTYMRNCDTNICSLENSGKTLKIRVPNASEQPYQGTCDGSTITDGTGTTSGTTNNLITQATPKTTRPPQTTTTSKPTSPPVKPNLPPVDLSTAVKKFILELDEPGDDLPDKTRKFILYFSSPVIPKIDTSSQTIRFEPPNGDQFNGLLQVAYAGSSQRGDGSQTSFFDSYEGVYSYMPRVQYCVSDSANKGYLSFLWNPVDVTGDTATDGKLLMVAMPHHDLLMQTKPVATPFTFKGYVSNDWSMELPVPHTGIDPDPLGVMDVKDNPSQLQVKLDCCHRINSSLEELKAKKSRSPKSKFLISGLNKFPPFFWNILRQMKN
ncbi:endo-1,3(4)-beta-glucanase 1 [Plakobranchus ocellatus]|uniref:Endo-1,3(4)-beta-glucanase 1 n=1 Tax=Plakobranchus ocellatus TaxID=259542 RepID=A0AAV4BQ58_9GAST|nr:endo-1,3(4)-beta-glucanase 1 [Plakobranchus ocellatus]